MVLNPGSLQLQDPFKPGVHNNADMLSRLPLPDFPNHIPNHIFTTLPPSYIKKWTNQRTMIQQGWKFTNDANFKPYMRRREELTVHDSCVLWGSRVVVPPQGRTKVIKELHEHPGSTRMKALTRSFVWWPQLDRDLENVVQSCEICLTYRHLPPMAPLQPWEWPQRPCLADNF